MENSKTFGNLLTHFQITSAKIKSLQKLKNVFNFMINGNTTHQIYKIYLNKCSEENLKL